MPTRVKIRTLRQIQAKLKRLFVGTIEQKHEAEMDEELGYEKKSVFGNNTGNSRNGCGKKTLTSNYGECEIEQEITAANYQRLQVKIFVEKRL